MEKIRNLGPSKFSSKIWIQEFRHFFSQKIVLKLYFQKNIIYADSYIKNRKIHRLVFLAKNWKKNIYFWYLFMEFTIFSRIRPIRTSYFQEPIRLLNLHRLKNGFSKPMIQTFVALQNVFLDFLVILRRSDFFEIFDIFEKFEFFLVIIVFSERFFGHCKVNRGLNRMLNLFRFRQHLNI